MGVMGVYDSGGGCGGARASRTRTSTFTVSKNFMGTRKSSEGNVVSRSKSKLNGAAGQKNKESKKMPKKNSRSTVLRLMWLRDITCGPRTVIQHSQLKLTAQSGP